MQNKVGERAARKDKKYKVQSYISKDVHKKIDRLSRACGISRLLDWSESFATALFFAINNWDFENGNARVWMLDPSTLNKNSLGSGKLIFTENDSYTDRLFKKNSKNFLKRL